MNFMNEGMNTDSEGRFSSRLVVLNMKNVKPSEFTQCMEITNIYVYSQAQFEEQEVEYHSLMMEKEQFEREELEIKLRDIRRRIAARKIQRFYRAYLTKRSKKGLKKGKKGKKKK